MPPAPENPLTTSAQFSDDVDSGTKAKNDQESHSGTKAKNDQESHSGTKAKNDQESQDGPSSSSGGGLGSAVDQAAVVDMTLEENLVAERVCRICHLSNEQCSGSPELIQLGCNCREDLGVSHRHCAEAWFKQKGNRLCEICNKTAKNVRATKDTRIYVMEINQIRPMAMATSRSASLDSPGDSSRRCKQSCNFILACLVLAFLITTFLRVKLF